MSTIDTADSAAKTPIYLFKKECVDCSHLNASASRAYKCHYSIPNSQGQCNEDCPAAVHYLVIGFNPERVADNYVKATMAGNNRKVIAIVTAVNNQHEDVQTQFWSLVHYKTAINIGAMPLEDDGALDDRAAQAPSDTVLVIQQDGQIDLSASAEVAEDQNLGQEMPGAPAADSGVDSNEWNEDE